MKSIIAAALALEALAGMAHADPVTPRTVTGYAAAAAIQRGEPLERPLPSQAEPGAVVTAPDGTTLQVPEQAPPTRRSMGLFGLSWSSH